MGLVPVLAESPVWLMHKGRGGEARKKLLLLRTRDSTEACEAVLEDLQDCARRQRDRRSDLSAGDLASDASTLDGGACAQLVCTRGPGRKALLIAIGLMFAQQVWGLGFRVYGFKSPGADVRASWCPAQH